MAAVGVVAWGPCWSGAGSGVRGEESRSGSEGRCDEERVGAACGVTGWSEEVATEDVGTAAET